MALFAKFEIQPIAKAAKVEKTESPKTQPSHVSQLSQGEQSGKLPMTGMRPCYCCKGIDYWLAGTEKYPHWVCRKCHPPAPGAERKG